MIRRGYKYTARFVKHRSTGKGQEITEFQIGSKVKGSDDYWNVRFTVWGGLDVADGDTVVLDKILSIEARLYEGRVYYDMIGHAHLDDAQPRPAVNDKDVKIPFDLD